MGCSWGSCGFVSGGDKVSQGFEVVLVVKRSNFTERELQTHLQYNEIKISHNILPVQSIPLYGLPHC